MTPEGTPVKMPGRNAARVFGSFRPLIIAWAAIVGAAALSAIALQVIGPPHPAPKLAQVETTAKSAPAPQDAPKTGATTSEAAVPAKAPEAAAPVTAPAAAAPAPQVKTATIAQPPQRPAARATPGPAPPLTLSGKEIPDPVAGMIEPATELPGQMLPRISSAGRRPEEVYAAFFNPDERHPRVALVMDGVGLDRSLSEHAMQALPAAIDFAYSAYAPSATASALAAEGRRRGRECLVSLPMEPSGYPLVDEGTKSLLTGAEPTVNRQNMQAALGHVQGCVGATGASDGMSGERFAGMFQEFSDVLTELFKRGLLYLDPRETVAVTGQGGPASRSADMVVDRAPDTSSAASPETIDARLAVLERRAQERGTAIGVVGPPTPMLIERLAVWSNSLAAHGVVLAPLTAIHMPDLVRPADEAVH